MTFPARRVLHPKGSVNSLRSPQDAESRNFGYVLPRLRVRDPRITSC